MSRTEIVAQFIAARQANKTDDVLAMVSEDFELDHFSDGKVNGKAAYKEYLSTHAPPNGETEAPVEKDGGIVEVKGFVKKLMMKWGYTLEFKFVEGDNLIHGVRIFRGRIDPKDLDPATNLPAKRQGQDVNAELVALFNRLSVFSDEDLVLEAVAYIETYTAETDVAAITADTAAHIADCMATRGTMVGLQRAGLSALANLASGSDRLQGVVVERQGVGLALAAMDTYDGDADLVYKAYDVLATLVANNEQAREEVSNPICLRTIFATMTKHRTSVDIQFGAACTLAGAVMNSPGTVKTLLVLDGLKQLIDCFRNAAMKLRPGALAAADVDDWRRVMQWTQLALRNIVRSSLVTLELLEQTNFGKFGECVPVDELKLQLKIDVKRMQAAK